MTPPTAIETKLMFTFKIELVSDKNIKYLVLLKADDYSNLTISAENNSNELNPKIFTNSVTTEKIMENKYFLQFDNLKEICEELSEKLKKMKK